MEELPESPDSLFLLIGYQLQSLGSHLAEEKQGAGKDSGGHDEAAGEEQVESCFQRGSPEYGMRRTRLEGESWLQFDGRGKALMKTILFSVSRRKAFFQTD
jgi:hypothetical protein